MSCLQGCINTVPDCKFENAEFICASSWTPAYKHSDMRFGSKEVKLHGLCLGLHGDEVSVSRYLSSPGIYWTRGSRSLWRKICQQFQFTDQAVIKHSSCERRIGWLFGGHRVKLYLLNIKIDWPALLLHVQEIICLKSGPENNYSDWSFTRFS
jgi:hypothetical protein